MTGLDAYSIPARLFPSVLVMLPLGLTVAVLFPQDLIVWGTGGGIASTTGIAFLMTEHARRRGKIVQKRIFEQLGAKQTTIMLRHRNDLVDPTTKARYHKCLTQIIPGMSLPSSESEMNDPATADQQYDSCVKYMLEQTRDRKQFPLVFKELVSYGWIRNLRGMKPAAIGVGVLGTITCATRALYGGIDAVDPTAAVGTFVSASILTIWIFRLNDQWVIDAGFDYAKALFASCDRLSTLSTA